MTRHIFFGDFLIYLDVIAPRTDGRHVGALDCIDAVIRASGEFKFEFVRQCRAVHIVQIVIDDGTHGFRLVVTGHLTTCRTNTRHRSTQSRASTTEIEAHLIELIKRGLNIGCRAALEHDVARLAVKSNQA